MRTQQLSWSTLHSHSHIETDSPLQINSQIGNRGALTPNFIRASLDRSNPRSTLNPGTKVLLPIRLSHPQAGSVASTELP
jgi:hypothetical protein